MPCIICASTKERKKFTYSSTDFFECCECGLIRTHPFPSEIQITKHYRKKFVSGNYNTILLHMEMYRDIYRTYIDLLKNITGSLTDKKILDVGCFTGDFLDLAKAEGAITYGIELQKEAFDIAVKKHSGRILNCNFSQADFHEKFDIVTLFGIIEHVTNPELLLEKISVWTMPGGMLVIQTPDTGSIFARLLGKYWPPYAPVEHIHYFSRNNITQFLGNYQYTNIEVVTHRKKLSIQYVYTMLENFGSEFHSLFTPLYKILPDAVRVSKLTFCIGEMIVTAEKKPC